MNNMKGVKDIVWDDEDGELMYSHSVMDSANCVIIGSMFAGILET